MFRRSLVLMLALFLPTLSAATAADVTVEFGPTSPPPQSFQFEPMNELAGVRRSVARVNDTLTLFLDELGTEGQPGYQALLIAENTLQSNAALPSINFKATVKGKTIECTGLRRLIKTHWLLAGTPELKPTNLLQPNQVTWPPATWHDVQPLSVAPVIKAGLDMHATGAAAQHGFRVGWANDPIAVRECAKVYGHLPITLRDATTLAPVLDAKICMGPKWVGVLAYPHGLSKDSVQMTVDTNHAWSALEPTIATQGTVYWRVNYDTAISLAVSMVCHDFNGDLHRINPRGSGRKARAVIDAIALARANGDTAVADWLEPFLVEWWAYYEIKADDLFSISSAKHLRSRVVEGTNGSITINEYAITQYEYLPLMYALYLGEAHFKQPSRYLRNYLEWQRLFGKMPYWTYLASSNMVDELQPDGKIKKVEADGKTWPMDQIKSHELNSVGTTGTGYYGEWGGYADLREALGMTRGEPSRSDERYLASFKDPLQAGFRLNFPPPPPRFTVAGKTLFKVDEARTAATVFILEELGDWDGADSFKATVEIRRE